MLSKLDLTNFEFKRYSEVESFILKKFYYFIFKICQAFLQCCSVS